MIYHVLPGDSLVEEFRKSEIDGDVIVCRECMIVGDVSAETLDELFEHRSHFLLIEYGTDEIDYHEQVADELSRLVDLPDGTIVNLWFEYELFCQVNLWFCLYLLSGTEATIYRVAPSERNSDEVWKGFGGMDERALKRCYDQRVECTAADVKLGQDLWQAYSGADHVRLRQLGESASPCFPMLAQVVEAEIEKDVRPAEILREIRGRGVKEFNDLFIQFTERAGVYGFGDAQLAALIDQSSS